MITFPPPSAHATSCAELAATRYCDEARAQLPDGTTVRPSLQLAQAVTLSPHLGAVAVTDPIGWVVVPSWAN